MHRLWWFGLAQAKSCAFPAAIFIGLAASSWLWRHVDMPLARYDALLVTLSFVLVAAAKANEGVIGSAAHVHRREADMRA